MASNWTIIFVCASILVLPIDSTFLDRSNYTKFIDAIKLKLSFQRDEQASQKSLESIVKEKQQFINNLFRDSSLQRDPDVKQDLTQLIVSQGYPAQSFVVQTKDGFLLDLHRIPFGRNESKWRRPKPVVFLQHGLLSTACDWVINFPNDSLGFILADRGYDVWMGNSRGNTYSRNHITFKPYEDRFWNWSYDEMAKYDTTAFIDFILNKTEQSSLHYIGHSQGTIMAFALFSSQPEYQKKIRLFVGLAPIISLDHMKSPIKYLSLLTDEEGYEIFGRGDFLPNGPLIKFFADTFCDKNISEWICYNIVFLMCGYDISNLNQSRLVVYLNHTPGGASVKDMIHFAQMYRQKRFAMYDYGSPLENRMHYGQDTPPAYNASKVIVPSLLFTASNDWLADPKDVQFLESTLPNIRAKYNIPEWNHLDFVWGINAADKCYNKILEWLPKF